MVTTEKMVKNLTENFEKDGIQVLQANCIGFDNPNNIQGFEPDVIGWNPEKLLYHIGIVVDSQTISSDLTKQKVSTLSKLMMGKGPSEGERLPFFIGVPQEASNIADKRLEEIDVLSQGNAIKIIV
ncbi:hypothetical protein [Nitrosopumilus sp.]|uniref:hypothetical protein n=1 Tax=Nitrosopumilus sp. TaxID=2024843 RepID=UPI0034A09C63